MTGSIRNFEKLNFTPKSSVFCFSQGQTSEYDRLAQKCILAAFGTYLSVLHLNALMTLMKSLAVNEVASIGALLGSVSDTGTGSLLEKMHLLFTGPCTRKRPL